MVLPFLTLNDVNLTNKRILIREDFNVPIENGVIKSDLRIRAALPGIQQALAANAHIILMSHLGRPEAGKWQAEYSLEPVAGLLTQLLNKPVIFKKTGFNDATTDQMQVVLLENVRFLPGETENDAVLAQKMASLCDIFVLDAFGSAHRAHASTTGVAEYAPVAVAGPLLVQEITALNKIMQDPKAPVIAIIGGAKVSGKLEMLQSLCAKVSMLLIGGGMANTFLAAQGNNVGASLYEKDLLAAAGNLLKQAKQRGCEILLPTDVIIQDGSNKELNEIVATDKILDIGIATRKNYLQAIKSAATIIWNGPMGVFEENKFAQGTLDVANAVANSTAYSVVGGGDTIAALDNAHLTQKISYVSTGGGAFLEYIEGKTLPAIQALINKRSIL